MECTFSGKSVVMRIDGWLKRLNYNSHALRRPTEPAAQEKLDDKVDLRPTSPTRCAAVKESTGVDSPCENPQL
jgi:hypothetical protein